MPKSKRKRRRSKSKSGWFGVFQNGKKYQVRLSVNGRTKCIGSSYETAEHAAEAYDKETIKLGRPVSKLNFPKQAPVGYTPRQQPLRSDNAVGYRGVSKNGKKYQAQTKIAGKLKHIGTYDTAKEAAVAYDRAVLKAKKSTSLLNFPDMVHNLDVEPKRKKYKRSSIGYKGLSKQESGRFQAQIRINGKKKGLGTFDTAIQAAFAYDQAAIKAGRKKSTLNFPMDQKKEKTQKEKKEKKKQKEKKEKKEKIQKTEKIKKTEKIEKMEKKTQKKAKKKILTMQEYKLMLQA